MFAELFDRYADPLYGFLVARTGDRALAEDLLSVVFLEGWRCRHRVVLTVDDALPWLYGVALNVLRSRRRAMRRHRAALARAAAELATLPAAGAGPDEGHEAREALVLVRRLPRRERDVVSLCAIAGLSYEEAAQALGLPIGTVRSRLARGRARLVEWRAGEAGDAAPILAEAEPPVKASSVAGEPS